MAAARLALAGNGSIAEAGRQLLTFEKTNQNELPLLRGLRGDRRSADGAGNGDQADAVLQQTGRGPLAGLQAACRRAGGPLAGRSRRPTIRPWPSSTTCWPHGHTGPQAEPQKLAAALGKADGPGRRRQDRRSHPTSVEEIIAKADPENQELHARAYNVLGNCYLAAGKKKEALLAFLHVDLLYARFPEQHAEALANLATLWTEVDKADRAAQAKHCSKKSTQSSAWAQK